MRSRTWTLAAAALLCVGPLGAEAAEQHGSYQENPR